jgi:hypothetical protein
MDSNCMKSRSGRHAHACVGMLALGLVVLAGCETSSQPAQQAVQQPQQQPAQQPQQPQAVQQPQPVQSQPAQPQPSQQTQPAAVAPPAPTPPPEAEKKVEKKAEVGVGKKGRGYGKGVVATPAASLFAVRERLVFEVQIPEAMKLFKATEDRAPKSHEEFMEKIIAANNIKLPELPDGDRYRYDPKTAQLMVESPAPE